MKLFSYQKIFDKLLNMIVRSDRNCGFYHHKTVLFDIFRNLAANGRDIAQIGRTVRLLRRTNPYKDRIRIFISAFIVCCIMQFSGCIIFLHQLFQSVFINRRNTGFHLLYFIFIHIHTSNVMSFFCKADTCYQSYISGSCHYKFHFCPPSASALSLC